MLLVKTNSGQAYVRARTAACIAELLTLRYATDLRPRRRGRPAKRPGPRLVSIAAAAVLKRLELTADDVLHDDTTAAALEEHAAKICMETPDCLNCPLVSFCDFGKKLLRGKSSTAPTVIDLFSGAGGLGLGFRKAGFRVALAVEMNRDAAQTYRLNHPGVPVLEIDVAKLAAKDVLDILGGQPPAVVCAGPPCQSYSAAGPRLVDDPRHRLYRHVVALAHALGSQIVVIENVPGMEERRVGERTYRDIVATKLGEHFNVETYLLEATAFGVPQERRRLIFLGRSVGRAVVGEPTATHDRFGRKGIPRTPTVMETLARLPRRRNGSRNDVAIVDGKLTRNLSTMRHSDRVVEKIRKIVPGSGPLSYRRVPRLFAQTIIAGHRALPVHPTSHRALSVREAAALQGFPDTYVFAGSRASQPLQVANAVPPPLALAMAGHIMTHLRMV